MGLSLFRVGTFGFGCLWEQTSQLLGAVGFAAFRVGTSVFWENWGLIKMSVMHG